MSCCCITRHSHKCATGSIDDELVDFEEWRNNTGALATTALLACTNTVARWAGKFEDTTETELDKLSWPE